MGPRSCHPFGKNRWQLPPPCSPAHRSSPPAPESVRDTTRCVSASGISRRSSRSRMPIRMPSAALMPIINFRICDPPRKNLGPVHIIPDARLSGKLYGPCLKMSRDPTGGYFPAAQSAIDRTRSRRTGPFFPGGTAARPLLPGPGQSPGETPSYSEYPASNRRRGQFPSG